MKRLQKYNENLSNVANNHQSYISINGMSNKIPLYSALEKNFTIKWCE